MKNVVFEMLRRVSLVKTDVSEEPGSSIIRVTRIGELGITLAVTSNRHTLRNVLGSSETSVLTRATRCYIPEEVILLDKIKLTLVLNFYIVINSTLTRIARKAEHEAMKHYVNVTRRRRDCIEAILLNSMALSPQANYTD
jgi:hypothetical protein